MRSWRALGRRPGRGADGGGQPVLTGGTSAPTGASPAGADARAQDGRAAEAKEDRIARGEGAWDQIDRGADVREQNRLTAPGGGRPGTPE